MFDIEREGAQISPVFPRLSKPPPSATSPHKLDMPETGRTGKRMHAGLCRGWTQPCEPSAAVTSSLSPDSASGTTSDPAVIDRPKHHRAPTRGGQILQRLPADDRLRRPHPVPRSHPTIVGVSRASSLSLADALCRRPRRRLGGRMTILRLQSCIRHHRVDLKSLTGSEHTAPRRGYFFFLAATLRLAGAFFFAAVFAFVAFFTILPS
jgi:hypothetical protein